MWLPLQPLQSLQQFTAAFRLVVFARAMKGILFASLCLWQHVELQLETDTGKLTLILELTFRHFISTPTELCHFVPAVKA